MKAVIFVGSGKIAYGKLSQALDLRRLDGSNRAGDFDDAMARVREVSSRVGNLPGQQRQSLPPGRAEDDHVSRLGGPYVGRFPDWIVVPGGNLGNSSAFGKAFHELKSWAHRP